MLEKQPKDPYAHAANYVNDPKISNRITNFLKSKESSSCVQDHRDAETNAAITMDSDGQLAHLLGDFFIDDES